jgi:hypothetical protein
MIQIPNDYDSARAYDGSAAPLLTPGGHICRIRGARVEQSRSGNDMLVVAFDIVEEGEFNGYYHRRFERAKSYNAYANWPGVFRASILTADGRTNGYFKGFIEAVEASNAGYSFRQSGGNEAMLNGKLVGFNFGEEDYRAQDGSVKTAVKPFYAVSVAKVREGIAPPAKKLLADAGSAPRPVGQPDANGFQQVVDDDLPF